jgi:hypothetical protein
MAVSTTTYEWIYGKAPRGFGMWAFKIGYEEKFFTGKYGEAKKQAIAYAKEQGARYIEVLT